MTDDTRTKQRPCEVCESPSYKRVCNDCGPKLRVANYLVEERPDILERAAETSEHVEVNRID